MLLTSVALLSIHSPYGSGYFLFVFLSMPEPSITLFRVVRRCKPRFGRATPLIVTGLADIAERG